MNKHKKELLEIREQLIEMYKAGFLDGYKVFKKLGRSKANWEELNKKYADAFCKRFENKVKAELNKQEDKKA